jgi:hypothetical protein
VAIQERHLGRERHRLGDDYGRFWLNGAILQAEASPYEARSPALQCRTTSSRPRWNVDGLPDRAARSARAALAAPASCTENLGLTDANRGRNRVAGK